MKDETKCELCDGTGCLTRKGILKVYLLALKLPLVLMFTGLLGGVIYSKYMFILAIVGFGYPLVFADLRLYLYPIATIAHCFGKKLSCPKCEPHCSMFRRI